MSSSSLFSGRAYGTLMSRLVWPTAALLLGTKEHGAPDPVPSGPWETFRERGVFPDLEALQLIARAITPPRRPKRFDTRFFAIEREFVADEVPGLVGPDSELIELAWVTLAEARKLDLPTITLTVLDELENRIAAGYAPELPIPFYSMRNKRFIRELL